MNEAYAGEVPIDEAEIALTRYPIASLSSIVDIAQPRPYWPDLDAARGYGRYDLADEDIPLAGVAGRTASDCIE